MNIQAQMTPTSKPSWLDRPVLDWLQLNYEKGLYLALVLAAAFTRFYRLGDRVMSHDESLHTYYSWNLYAGHGFAHTPLMHGPFLFHINALIYSLFGADDFTARISVALFGVALVALPWTLRRWLGRAGALIVSLMFLISPSIWYHARYIRNESFVTVWVMLLVWAMFRYWRPGALLAASRESQERDARWLYLLAGAGVLLLATKEVSFIYAAIFCTFLLLALLGQMLGANKTGWDGLGGLGAGVGGSVAILALGLGVQRLLLDVFGVGVSEVIAGDGIPKASSGPNLPIGAIIFDMVVLGVVGAAAGAGIYFLLRRLLPEIERVVGAEAQATLDLLIVLGTLFLPTLSPFAMVAFKIDPMDYGPAGIVRAGGIFLLFLAVSAAVGLWWDTRRWLISAGLWYGLGVTLFTTVFTNGGGIASGFVGSLGYWLAQQGVQRGSQPVYYYLIVTPLYEYFPILASLAAAVYYAIRGAARQKPFILFLVYWIALTWFLYSYAGEKMPWLMVHLALPMILLAGAFLGEVAESVNWRGLGMAWLTGPMVVLAITGLTSLSGAMAAGAFRSNQVADMVATGQWIAGLLAVAGAATGLVWSVTRAGAARSAQVLGLTLAALLALATFRTGWRWNLVNYDYPIEHGVYAHGGAGVKIALRQIEEIADRTTGRSALKIAYDSDSSWPFTWYLRDYTGQAFFGSSPTRESLDAPVVLAGNVSWATVEPILGKRYDAFTYRLIWWPMEDYKVFTECPVQETTPDGRVTRLMAYDENADGTIDSAELQRGSARCSSYTWRNSARILWEWISDPARRLAIWDIFWNRDYRRYDQVTGKKHTLEQWPLVHEFKLYVRKDVAAQVWDLGVGPVVARTPVEDPYAKGKRELAAIQVIGSPGSGPGQLSAPHGLAIAPDGSLYVADSNNHRIQKFSPEGQFVLSFGVPGGGATPGAMNEPWGVAVGPDGSVYVADTWNHRIQKFGPDGKFITAWGQAGQTDGTIRDDPANYYTFWGPRGVAVDSSGHVYVTDTGDKRIVVFDGEGKYLRQFGGRGIAPGQLDEPVGIAVSPDGNLVVADTWNQRVQVLSPQGAPLNSWPIDGWIGQAVTNKPYLAVDTNGYVYVADPTGFRILIFGFEGTFVATFGDAGADNKSFQLPVGVAVDKKGYVYVSDAGAGRVLKFAPINFEATSGDKR